MFARWVRLSRSRIAAAILLTASAAIPQDLAPEVLLLSRIKRHLREELTHIPNYTCLETISRFRDDPKSLLRSRKGFAILDTVRLEIVFAHGREWYGSPGARNLSVDNPVAFVGGGMIGTGAFAMALHNIVEGGIFTYRGEETVDGRHAVKYDFRLPQLLKTLEIAVAGSVGTVGEEGSIWIDAQSLDLIRAESRAAEIPPFLPVQEAGTNVNYARMRIGDSNTLLAQQADSSMHDGSNVASYNRIEFTHCRSYTATSTISFDSKPEPAAAAVSTAPVAPPVGPAIPPFLEIAVLLATPVSDKDSVGTLIEGKTSGDVVQKGKVVVPDGSLVHGRIRRLEHYPDRGVFGVGLELHGSGSPR